MTMEIDITVFEKVANAYVIDDTTLNGMPGMTSREISEITGKNHKNVLRDIRKMLDEISSDLSPCQWVDAQTSDSYGRLQPLTILDKELTFTLLSRYSFKLSNLIVKRWLTLEGSGFTRVSVLASVGHLVEREKDNYRQAMKAMKRGPQNLSPAARAYHLRKTEQARIDARARRNIAREGC